MTGLSLTGNSSMIDWLRKNEPRGDRLHVDDGNEDIWFAGTIPTITVMPPATKLYIVDGIEIIIELADTETMPILTIADIRIYYPETENVSIPIQKIMTLDTTNRGINALLAACERDSLKLVDLSGANGAVAAGVNKFVTGFINLNNVILDSGQQDVQKYVRIEPQAGLTIAGTGRIIFRIIGWKILKSDW